MSRGRGVLAAARSRWACRTPGDLRPRLRLARRFGETTESSSTVRLTALVAMILLYARAQRKFPNDFI
eukprot:4533762-Heterocapsa_arctica.AAC.1